MTPLRIDIPNAKPPRTDEVSRAADIFEAALREAGLQPLRAIRNPMVRGMAGEWFKGAWTRAQFVHACRNMGILNPGLKG